MTVFPMSFFQDGPISTEKVPMYCQPNGAWERTEREREREREIRDEKERERESKGGGRQEEEHERE